MIQYLNTFTTEPQREIFLVTEDHVNIGTPVQIAVDKKGNPVMKEVKEVKEKRDSPGYTKINPQYYEVIV